MMLTRALRRWCSGGSGGGAVVEGALHLFQHPTRHAEAVGRLDVVHHMPALCAVAARLRLIPFATPAQPQHQQHDGATTTWYDSDSAASQPPLPPLAATAASFATNPQGARMCSFGGRKLPTVWNPDTGDRRVSFITLHEEEVVHPDAPGGRAHVSLEHRGASLLGGWLPLPHWLLSMHSDMVAHDDDCGWDIVARGTAFGGKPFVTYTGSLRLVPPRPAVLSALAQWGGDGHAKLLQPAADALASQQLLHSIVLFDGYCNMCNNMIDWLLTQDTNHNLAFGVLQSDAAKALLHARGTPHLVEFRDSVLYLPAGGGAPRLRGAAVLGIGQELRWPWSVMARLGRLVLPQALLNPVYNWIGRNRYRWFGKSPSVRARGAAELQYFIPGGERAAFEPGRDLFVDLPSLGRCGDEGSSEEARAACEYQALEALLAAGQEAETAATVVVVVYDPQCGYCERLQPVWAEAAAAVQPLVAAGSIKLARCMGQAQPHSVREGLRALGVATFPTILAVHPQPGVAPRKYGGASEAERTPQSIREFIESVQPQRWATGGGAEKQRQGNEWVLD